MEKSDARNYRTMLLDEMKSGQFSHCSKLPRETELAEMLSISRTQLRDVLSELEREGYITRRHGVGTLINRHVLQVKNRMDIETELMDIIRNCGYEPSVASMEIWESYANSRIAEKLQISEGTPVLCKRAVYAADGRHTICYYDVIDKALVKKEYTHDDFRGVIFDFLRQFCGINAYMDLTELHAVAANEATAAALFVPEGTPLLNMEEVDFDVDGNPIFYSSQYFVDGLIQQTVLRKKL